MYEVGGDGVTDEPPPPPVAPDGVTDDADESPISVTTPWLVVTLDGLSNVPVGPVVGFCGKKWRDGVIGRIMWVLNPHE